MIGSLVVILSYILIPQLRSFPSTKLVFYLVCCDFFFSSQFAITGFLPAPGDIANNEWLCKLQVFSCSNIVLTDFQGVWLQFAGMGSVSWNAAISANLLLIMRDPFSSGSPYHKWYHLVVWTMCFGTTAAIIGMNEIGNTGEGLYVFVAAFC